MATLFGRTYTRHQLLRRVGAVSQLGGTRLIELADGNQRGVRACDLVTGSGFQCTVLLDRGMDIGAASHCGRSLSWHGMPGPVHPAFHEPHGLGFLRTFHGGLLCTCGLTYAGAPCTDEGEELGLHGRISHIPARHVGTGGQWDGDDYDFWVTGEVREASVFGPNMVLRRTVRARLGESRIAVEDRVTNEGFEPAPFMLLYHINGGFPVVDEGAELLSPTVAVDPVTDYADERQDGFAAFAAPQHGVPEECFRHTLAGEQVVIALVNRELGDGFGYAVEFDRSQLPHFTEWKMMGEGMYVVGTEPCTMPLFPRNELRERGELEHLEPGEERRIELTIRVIDSADQIDEIERRCKLARETV
jgi:hypothetical protein